LPHVPLLNIPVKFDLRLKDIPGPDGVALPLVDWRIVRAPDEHGALISDHTLVTGQSDAHGAMQLSDDEQSRLHEQWNQTPGQLWIVAEGHVHQLVLTKAREDWTELQKLNFSLDAMGFSDDLGSLRSGIAGVDPIKLARQQTQLGSATAMLKSIEKAGKQ
jgi:hypothetical protein